MYTSKIQRLRISKDLKRSVRSSFFLLLGDDDGSGDEETRGTDDRARPLDRARGIDGEVSNVGTRDGLSDTALLRGFSANDAIDLNRGDIQMSRHRGRNARADRMELIVIGGVGSRDVNVSLQVSRTIGVVLSRSD